MVSHEEAHAPGSPGPAGARARSQPETPGSSAAAPVPAAAASDFARRGLSDAQVAERRARGLVNDVPDTPSRTVKEIVRANVVTRFNILLSVMLLVILIAGPVQDALFGIVLVVNTGIGIVQELRAKATLDRLALLSAPRARVVRGGVVLELPIAEVVLDDVIELRAGDQVVVDGRLLTAEHLEVNEALLTGESEPVAKGPGAGCLSGSFVVAGRGRYQATKVGKEAYAVRLAEEARRFTLVRSELRAGIDWVLAMVSWAIVPTVGLLVWSQLRAASGVREAARGAVAGTVGMVPQGLVLLLSVAFAVGVVRLGRRKVLTQELPAVEGLARVDTICFDKTGTLTEGRLEVVGVEQIDPGLDPAPVLAALAAADPSPNATLAAIGAHFPLQGAEWTARRVVPFSSARKWSGASFDGAGSWVLGAPEVVLPDERSVMTMAEDHAAHGRRVLALARAEGPWQEQRLPAALRPAALVVLGDRVRPTAAETLRYFAEQGVSAKVISGDHPRTVAAIAAEVGIPGADRVVDARELPSDRDELGRVLEDSTVFGRVSPHQKREMVAALQQRSHVVAMTGDGVNDVLALKDADISIAMGSGSPASRAVANLLLLDASFDVLPDVVGEGRRVIANIERVANLFVTKTVYALLLALAVGVAGRPFPFLPRHLTVVGSLTIGIPAFFLALEPSARRARAGFVKRVLRFALPTGTLAALATFLAYELARVENVTLAEARTTATFVLASIGLFALVIVSRPLTTGRRAVVAGMTAGLLLLAVVPSWRAFFALNFPRPVVVLAAVGIVGLTGAFMYFALRALGWLQHMPELVQAVGERLPSAEQVTSAAQRGAVLLRRGRGRVGRWLGEVRRRR